MNKISIITVCYNSVTTISDTIESVLSQTYPNVEYIIIDGGSVDGTLDLIKSYNRQQLTKVVSEPDKGIYDAMNKGISLASGDIIGFLNADDLYTENRVLDRVIISLSDPTINSCYSDFVYVDPDNLNKIVRYWKSCNYKDGLLQKGWTPPHPTFFVRKSIYEKFGYFDLDFKLAADFELMMRFLGRYKITTIYIPHVLVKMRLGGATNKSIKNIIKQNIEIIKSYKKNNIIFLFHLFFTYKIINRINQFYSR